MWRLLQRLSPGFVVMDVSSSVYLGGQVCAGGSEQKWELAAAGLLSCGTLISRVLHERCVSQMSAINAMT